MIFNQFLFHLLALFSTKKPMTGFSSEKFGPPLLDTPDLPNPESSPGGNVTHETCMNEVEKCIKFLAKSGILHY
jgi:hypothetical protein